MNNETEINLEDIVYLGHERMEVIKINTEVTINYLGGKTTDICYTLVKENTSKNQYGIYAYSGEELLFNNEEFHKIIEKEQIKKRKEIKTIREYRQSLINICSELNKEL